MAVTNEDFDRSVTVFAKIIEGTLPLQTSLDIVHYGIREKFIPADDTEGMQVADNQEYGVLKQ